MNQLSIIAIAALILLGQACTQNKKSDNQNVNKMNTADGTEQYTFKLSDKVTRQKAHFKSRYGITLTGDLYLPKGHGNEPLAAIAISGSFGAVKEQSSGLYANQMGERGFAALAFDPSFTGESEGEPRHVASPDINTEDFSAAVDFLCIQKNIHRNKIILPLPLQQHHSLLYP